MQGQANNTEKKNVIQQEKPRTYWYYVKRQFKKNKLAVWALRAVYFLIFIAIFADFIANEKPIVMKYKDKVYFPIFREYLNAFLGVPFPDELRNIPSWRDLQYDWALFPPIPYSPQNIDLYNVLVGPFDEQDVPSWRWRHWLGTDDLGRDVASGLIHATRIALSVGIVSMGIAAIIGILLGSLAGYFGDDTIRASRASIILGTLMLVLGYFYAIEVRKYVLIDSLKESILSFVLQLFISAAIFLGLLFLAWVLARPFRRVKWLGERVFLPMDMLVSRLIEVIVTIPSLFLIVAIVAIAEPSLFLVMAVIGLTGWTGIARFIRAELLRIRNLQYIEAARSLGFPHRRILIRHAIPNALTPVLISIAFGIASAILTESTLSFLGLGVPPDTVTWGSILSLSRKYPESWWLAIFPGSAIFITVTLFNLIGEGLIYALDPRFKR